MAAAWLPNGAKEVFIWDAGRTWEIPHSHWLIDKGKVMIPVLISCAMLLLPDPATPTAPSRHRPSSYKVIEVKSFGAITGTVRYSSALPPPRRIEVDRDHECCDRHSKEEPLIKVSSTSLVAEAVVFLSDIAEGKPFDKPGQAPQLDQKKCSFEPRVLAVPAGVELKIVNSDPVAHNVKAVQRSYTIFNVLQPFENMRSTQRLEKPGLVRINCNVHNWMQAFIHVFRHPYYQVTDKTGAFRIDLVPVGHYKLTVWQEYLGEQTFDVEVRSGVTTQLYIDLEPLRENTGR